MPWAEHESLIAPHYPKEGKGRPAVGLSIMLRVYFLQHWFNLSDPGAEEALYDSHALRRFAGVDLGRAAAPDEMTILNLRHLLERHDLCGAMLDAVTHCLEDRGIRNWIVREPEKDGYRRLFRRSFILLRFVNPNSR